MAGEKPRYKVTIKSKTTPNKANIGAFWVRDNGMIGGTLDQDVEYIKLKNGAKITNENAWLNMWDNGDEQDQRPNPSDEAKEQQQDLAKNQAYDTENDIPF